MNTQPTMEDFNSQPLIEENQRLSESLSDEGQRGTLVQTIRQWVQNDRDMNLLKKELAKRRETQKNITGKLVELMRENEMEEDDIMYVQETKKKSISKKGLIPILFRFYKGDTAKAAELTQYIYDNRETVVTEKIKPKAVGKKG
jgi:hypothetical protein